MDRQFELFAHNYYVIIKINFLLDGVRMITGKTV